MKIRKRNHKNKLLYQALKSTHLLEILCSFLATYWIVAYLIYRIDPAIGTFGDSLWYCFELVTTIGFGETVAVTPFGKVLSVILSLYSIAVIAIVTSTIVAYYQLAIRRQEDVEYIFFIKQMERLPELSKEELKELSDLFKQWHP